MMHILQEEVPLLFKLFSDIDGIPPPLFSILRTMLKIAYQPFLAPDSNLENYCNADDNEDTCISLSYFPSLPIIRQRGNYRNDLNRLGNSQYATRKEQDILHYFQGYSLCFVVTVTDFMSNLFT